MLKIYDVLGLGPAELSYFALSSKPELLFRSVSLDSAGKTCSPRREATRDICYCFSLY